jgi:hypothetical protein
MGMEVEQKGREETIKPGRSGERKERKRGRREN